MPLLNNCNILLFCMIECSVFNDNWWQAEACLMRVVGAVEIKAQGVLRRVIPWPWIEHPTFQLRSGHSTTFYHTLSHSTFQLRSGNSTTVLSFATSLSSPQLMVYFFLSKPKRMRMKLSSKKHRHVLSKFHYKYLHISTSTRHERVSVYRRTWQCTALAHQWRWYHKHKMEKCCPAVIKDCGRTVCKLPDCQMLQRP